MRLLFVLCLGCTLDCIVGNNVKGKNKESDPKFNLNENDDKMIHLIEQQMLSLNKSSDASRDKRALGILLQGFMEALGYTVSPLQIASLANSAPASQMPAMTLQQGSAPSITTNSTPSGPTPPPRQRETLRFTGVLNFGNNANTSNLVNHLAQYEQLFHPGSMGITPPSPPPMPSIDPRTLPPLPEPLFVKIPLPIVPNLPPPQPPSSMPIKISYENDYSNDHFKEYQANKDEEGQQGEFEEEDDNSHHKEEYENKREQHNEPGDRNYEYDSYEKPDGDKNTEKEYKNNKNVVNYTIENKDIYDPHEVSEEVSRTSTRFNHAVYVNEPDWEKKHEAQLYKLAAEQEAHAEALAEENTEREKERDREHELNDEYKEFHNNREKEINNHNKDQEAKYETNFKQKPYYNEQKQEDEDSGSSEKENYNDNRRENDNGDNDNDDDDYQEESKLSETLPKNSRNTTSLNHISAENEAITEKSLFKEYNSYLNQNEPSFKYNKNYDAVKKQSSQQKNEPSKYYIPLPLSYNGRNSHRDHILRDSYGKSLEKPDGKVDERVSSYFTMFKNPETGIYDPNRIREYEISRIPYDHFDLVNGFKRIQKEYGSPEHKYEEYEFTDENDEQVEHRVKNNLRRPLAKDYEHEKSENESRKSVKKIRPEIKECDCNTKKGDGQSVEARNHGKAVTAGLLPSRISEIPTNYGPYRPTVKYLYEPLDYDQSIIASLTSHNLPTTTQFENTEKYIDTPGHTVAYQQTSTTPTELVIVDRITAKTMLPENESKEIRVWPAPFDYTYDYTQNNNVVLKKVPKNILKDVTNNQPTSHQAPFDTIKSNCHNDGYSLAPQEFKNKVKKLLRDHENDKFSVDARNKRQRLLASSLERPRLKTTKQQIIKNGYHSTHPPTSTTAKFDKSTKRQSPTERSLNYYEKNRPPTYPSLTLEKHTPHHERLSSTKNPNQNRKIIILEEDAKNRKEQQVPRTKPTVKKKYNIYSPLLSGKNSREESPSYVEKNGILIIPEPTPYYYSERVDDFLEEPKSETEKIKIKEYRNRIASVKVSNLKQLHPIGTTQIVKYSRHL